MPDNVRPMRGRSRPGGPKVRMTGQERRLQLVGIGRRLFAERGYEATSIEEISHQAGVSKPVVYEHFGGKEGLYAVVVHREVERLLTSFTGALSADSPRRLLQQATMALLTYVEDHADGFRILVRESPVPLADSGGFATIISDIANTSSPMPSVIMAKGVPAFLVVT